MPGYFDPEASNTDISAVDYDMVLQTGVDQLNTLSQIPGYELVNQTTSSVLGSANYYKRLGKDPYDLCDIDLDSDSDNLDKLLDMYYEMDLDVRNLKGYMLEETVTVADLVESIRAMSKYVYSDSPDVRMMYGNFNQHTTDNEPILNFVHLVGDDGKLNVQCTGAAQFLAESLKIALADTDDVEIDIITGHLLRKGDSNINAVGHAQVRLRHQGREYILDATPAADFVSDSLSSDQFYSYMQPQWGSSTNNQFSNEPEATEPIMIPAKPEQTPQQQLDDLLDNLGRTLRLQLGIPGATDEELANTLISQPYDDPRQLVMQSISSQTRDMPDQAKLPSAQVIKKLKRYLGADQDVRDRVLGSGYDNATLQSLIDTMEQYQQYQQLQQQISA